MQLHTKCWYKTHFFIARREEKFRVVNEEKEIKMKIAWDQINFIGLFSANGCEYLTRYVTDWRTHGTKNLTYCMQIWMNASYLNKNKFIFSRWLVLWQCIYIFVHHDEIKILGIINLIRQKVKKYIHDANNSYEF